jgi:ACS family tartrate transporter-like MFS transporter
MNPLRKATWRLLPFLGVCYVVAWLDRVNVGFAALQMNADLGFNAAVYGFGAGVFFVGYALCEVPSNLILYRVGARRWIARIMITWGILSSAMMFVRDPVTFYVLRFLLGAAEAGFLPGVIYYLGDWYPGRERARAVSWFMSAIPLSTVVGGPLAGALLELDGVMDLAGWQWLFMLEGLAAVLLGFVVLVVLPDRPEHAAWLTREEAAWIMARVKAEQTEARERHGFDLRRALLHPIVWQLGFVSFTFQAGSYGLNLWIPQIVQVMSGASELLVGFISAIPYVAAAAGMVIIGAHSDRSGERFYHIALPSLVSACAFIAAGMLVSPVLGMIALTVAAVGDLGTRGPFWALPTRFLAGTSAAGGIALINTLGSLGGFVGPYAVGLAKNFTDSFAGGLAVLAALLVAGAVATLALRGAPLLATARSRPAGGC